jgi:uncharacterized protein (TIGR01777 family)
MKVGIVGATGFVGRHVALRLQYRGHEVVALVRSADKATRFLGDTVEIREWLPQILGSEGATGRQSSSASSPGSKSALEGLDAVVNVAGSPLVGKRWSRSVLEEAEASRPRLTAALVREIASLERRPKVLVSASAVGYYGDRGAATIDESAPKGEGYLADLCARWEEAALRAAEFGVRVVVPRLGVVLGRFGGALEPLELSARLGIKTRPPWPETWVSWVHVEDMADAICKCVDDESLEGPLNVAAPNPVTYEQLFRSVAESVGPATKLAMAVPRTVAHLVLAGGEEPFQGGQAAMPAVLEAHGFNCRYPTLDEALRDLYESVDVVTEPGVRLGDVAESLLGEAGNLEASDLFSDPGFGCTASTKGVFVNSRIAVASGQADVARFHNNPINLGVLMPQRLRFAVISVVPNDDGSQVTYETGLGFIASQYKGRIFGFDETKGFWDRSEGPSPIRWLHRHRFIPGSAYSVGTASGDAGNAEQAESPASTIVSDDLWFTAPAVTAFGPVYAFIARQLFEYRGLVLKTRFGAPSGGQTPG